MAAMKINNKLENKKLDYPAMLDKDFEKLLDDEASLLNCVSVMGTTGVRQQFGQEVLDNLQRTYTNVEKNKMMIGFGIGSVENVKTFSPYCDGLIVGSAVIKKLCDDDYAYSQTIKLIRELSAACAVSN